MPLATPPPLTRELADRLYAGLVHTHVKADITNLETITVTPSADAVPKADGSGKLAAGWFPSTGINADTLDGLDSLAFSLVGHTHVKADVTNLETITATPTASAIPKADGSGKIAVGWLPSTGINADTLDGLDSLAFSLVGHTHVKSNITDLETITVTPTNGAIPKADGSHLLAAGWMPAFTGDATTSAGATALTLATVNSNVGSFNLANVTVNGKGLVTAASAASTTGSGNVVLATSPAIVTPTILKLANLTSNGFIKTSGGDGTLSIDTTTYLSGTQAHSGLSGLTSGDDHTQYALLLGRSGGQTLIGGTASGNGLTITSTSHATKGKLLIGTALTVDEVNARVGIGLVTPLVALDIVNASSQLRLGTGTTRYVDFQVDANNLLNITAPSGQTPSITILGPTNPYVMVTDTTNSAITKMQSFDSSGMVGMQSAHNFSIYTSNLPRITIIDTTGNTGIGTGSPAQKLHVFNGHLRLDQIATAGAPSVATGAAGVLTGAYIYMVTFVTATGETSAGTSSATVNPSSQQVALTAIPVSADASVTSRRIYRTAAGGSLFLLQSTIADNTTTTLNDNTADGSLGANAPFKNTTGGEVFVGTNRVMYADTTFTGLGVGAGNGTAIGGNQSVAIGTNALNGLTTGGLNVAVGYFALTALSTGTNNTAVGRTAGSAITTGTDNTLIGITAGRNNGTGSNNTWVGSGSGQGTTANNSNNTGLGQLAGASITSGGNNVLIGLAAGSNLTTGSSNIILGYSIQTPAVGTSNFMSIGNLIFSAGIDGTGTTVSSGNIGIGIAAPTAKLHISAASAAISSATWTTTGKVFATDALSITNTTSSGTVALQVEHSFGVPTLLASSSTTLTMSANVYIAGAPVASTNVTQTAKTALFIDTGAAASTALILRAAGSPSVDIFQVQTSANALLLSIASSGNLVFADAINVVFGTTTGTIIGTATSQKLSLWNATPNIQPTTAIVAAAFVANTSGTLNDSATYGGYTVGQIVAALKRLGALA